MTIDDKSKEKPKVVIVSHKFLSKIQAISMNKFMCLKIKKDSFGALDSETEEELEFNNHNIHWYWRKNLEEFLDQLLSHPRAIVVLSSSKQRRNTREFLSQLKSYLENESDWDDRKDEEGNNLLEKRMTWFEESILCQENHCETYKIEGSVR